MSCDKGLVIVVYVPLPKSFWSEPRQASLAASQLCLEYQFGDYLGDLELIRDTVLPPYRLNTKC